MSGNEDISFISKLLLWFNVTVVMVFDTSVCLSIRLESSVTNQSQLTESPGSDHQVVLWPTGTERL